MHNAFEDIVQKQVFVYLKLNIGLCVWISITVELVNIELVNTNQIGEQYNWLLNKILTCHSKT